MAESADLFILEGTTEVSVLPSTVAKQVAILDKDGKTSNVEAEISALREAISNQGYDDSAVVHIENVENITGIKNFKNGLTSITKEQRDNSNNVATTAFVKTAILNSTDLVHITGTEEITGDKKFLGTVTAITQLPNDNSENIATTAYVDAAIPEVPALPDLSNVVHTDKNETITGNKTFTGVVTANTPSDTDYGNTVATTKYVTDAIAVAALNNESSSFISKEGPDSIGGSKTFTGAVKVPLATTGDKSLLAANTYFVHEAISNAIAELGATGTGTGTGGNAGTDATAVHIAGAETIIGDKTFDGHLYAITRDLGDSGNDVATTEFVANAISEAISEPGTASYNSANDKTIVHIAGNETITGNKKFTRKLEAVTMPEGTSNLNVATTEFVMTAVSGLGSGSGSYSSADDNTVVHTTGDETISDIKTFTGALVAPTMDVGDSTENVATTEFVMTAISGLGSGSDTSSYNSADDNTIVHINGDETINDIKTYTGALLAPTMDVGDSTENVATTEFVMTAISGLGSGSGTSSYNSADDNTIVHINSDETINDIKTFTGALLAPTMDVGDSTENVATTEFVMTALSSLGTGTGSDSGSYNSANDNTIVHIAKDETITGNKDFTGTVTAITQETGISNGTVATTEFVNNAIAMASIAADGSVSTSNIVTKTSAYQEFTGTVEFSSTARAVTQATGDDTNSIATDEFVVKTVKDKLDTALTAYAKDSEAVHIANEELIVGKKKFIGGLHAITVTPNTTGNVVATVDFVSTAINNALASILTRLTSIEERLTAAGL